MAHRAWTLLIATIALVPSTAALGGIRTTELTLEGPSFLLVGSNATFEGDFQTRGGLTEITASRVELFVDDAPAGSTRAWLGHWTLVTSFPTRGVRTIHAVAEGDLPHGAQSPSLTLRVGVPPSAPASLVANAVPGAFQVALAWEPPTDDGGVPVASYRVERQTNGGAFVVLGTTLGSTRTFTDTTVTAATTYRYAVTATTPLGTSPRVEADVAGVAPLPPTLTLRPLHGTDHVQLTVAATGGVTQALEVQKSLDQGLTWTRVALRTGLQATVQDPTRFDPPRPIYRALAQSVVGNSGTTDATVQGEAPPAPTLTITPLAGIARNHIAVGAGGPVTQMIEVQVRLEGGSWTRLITLIGQTTTEAPFSLNARPSYRAIAHNHVGVSGPADATVASALPGVPTGVRVDTTDTTATLVWSPPATGGIVQGYRIFDHGLAYATTTGSVTTLPLVLTGGDHRFTVEARNILGDGPRSAEVFVAAPAAPTFTATALHASERVRLEAAVTDAFGKTLEVHRSVDGGATWTTIATGPAPTLVTEPTVSVSSPRPLFRALARGPTGPSDATPATLAGAPPGAPTDLALLPAASVTLRWTAAPGVVQGYVIRNHGNVVAYASPTAPSKTFTLPPGAYALTVQALSYAGDGPVSVALEGRLDPPSAPAVTTTVQELWRTGKVNVTWTAPASDGGAPIQGYEVWRTPGPWGGRALLGYYGPGTFAHLNDPIAGDGRTYTYEVIAKNAVGSATGVQTARLDLDWEITANLVTFRVCEGSTCTDVPAGGTYDRVGAGSVTYTAVVEGKLTRRDAPTPNESVGATGTPLHDEEMASGMSAVTDASGNYRITFSPWTHTPGYCQAIDLFIDVGNGVTFKVFQPRFTICP